MKQVVRFPLILGLICCFVASGVGGVYALTRKKIEFREQERSEKALQEIFGKDAQTELIRDSDDPLSRVFMVSDNNKEILGYVAVGIAQGYGSRLKILVGINNDLDKVIAIRVLYQGETPGLGARIEEVETKTTWFKLITGRAEKEENISAWYLEQFSGYPIDGDRLKVNEKGLLVTDSGKIDAISGATISSNAVIEAVNNAILLTRTALKAENDGR